VSEGTELAGELSETLEAEGVTFATVQTEIPDDLMMLVAGGDADAYGTSWTRGMRDGQDPSYRVVPASFNSAIAVYASHDEPTLSAALNPSLASLIDSEVWASEFLLAFGVSAPWSTEEMAAAR
jgi:hypothetical protein